MAKQRSWHWEHFHAGEKQNQAFKKAYCNYCVNVQLKIVEAEDDQAISEGRLSALRHREERLKDALSRVQPTSGRLAFMSNHLIDCQYVPTSVKEKARSYKSANDGAPATSSDPKHTRSESMVSGQELKKQKTFEVIAARSIPYTKETQINFEDQLLRAYVSSGTAFNKINDPEVQKFYATFIPSAALPSRQRLENQILRRVVVQLEGELKKEVKGHFATLSCDGWKDISRNHLVAFMVTVNRKVHALHVYDMSSKHKTAANLLPLMEKECDYVEKELGAIVLGMCGDAAGNEHRSRFDLVLIRPSYLTADCWAHQVSLMLGDFVKRNPEVKHFIEEVVEVIKWFQNHSYALGVFNEEQKAINGKALSFIAPVVTRWTAYFLSMDRLLIMWKPLQITAIKHETALLSSVGNNLKAKAKANTILTRIQNNSWWNFMAKVKTQIEPLTIAVNVAQAGNVRCDQILLLLGKLYKTYTEARKKDQSTREAASVDDHELTSILNSLERRWSKADQDLHIAAYFLNPCLSMKLINEKELSGAVLIGTLHRLYKRLFGTEAVPSEFMDNAYKYHQREGIYAPDVWDVNGLALALKGPDGTFDPVRLWKLFGESNPLAALASRILSFCPNSASAERLFSSMGNIKTKKRNRMHTQKLRDLAFLQLELRQQQAKQGLVHQRLRRNLGNVSVSSISSKTGAVCGSIDDVAVVEEVGEELDADPDSEGSDGEIDRELAPKITSKSFASLMQAYELDDDDDDDGNLPGMHPTQPSLNPPTLPRTVRLYFGQNRLIPIKSLFNWSVEEGWDQFWFEGMKNLRQEMEFYDLIATTERENEREADTEADIELDPLLSSLGGNEGQPITID